MTWENWSYLVVGVELLIILALAWLATWALNRAVDFGRELRDAEEEILCWQERADDLASQLPKRDSKGHFIKVAK